MTEMVDNLLTLARADEGPCDARRRAARPEGTAVARRRKPPAFWGGSGNHGPHRGAGQPVLLPVDRSRIRQLMLNLVTNAIKYTPARGQDQSRPCGSGRRGGAGGGRQRHRHRAPRTCPTSSTASTAPISLATRTGDRPGAGLGLAITKWIAEAHGGTIGVQSRTGRGTVFTVTLPRPNASPEVRQPKPKPRIGPSRAS